LLDPDLIILAFWTKRLMNLSIHHFTTSGKKDCNSKLKRRMAASSVARLKPSPFLLPIFCRRSFVSSSRRLIPPKVKEDEYVNPVNKLFPVLRPSFWMSLVPPPLRFWEKRTTPKKKGWNPATFHIWIFMIIGSNAINTIKMKSEYLLASRKTDIKIAQLKDVLDRVQRGEDVDVAKELGTGDEQREREWKDGRSL